MAGAAILPVQSVDGHLGRDRVAGGAGSDHLAVVMGGIGVVCGGTMTGKTGAALDGDHELTVSRPGQGGWLGMAMETVTLVDVQNQIGTGMTGYAGGLLLHKGIVRWKPGLEAVLVRMAGGAVDPDIVGGVVAVAVPVVSLGMADLADAGGWRVYGIGKPTLGVKKLDRPVAAVRGGDILADELAVEQAKGIGVGALRRLRAGYRVNIGGGDAPLDDDLSRGGGQHRESIDRLGLAMHQDEAASGMPGALVAPGRLRP